MILVCGKPITSRGVSLQRFAFVTVPHSAGSGADRLHSADLRNGSAWWPQPDTAVRQLCPSSTRAVSSVLFMDRRKYSFPYFQELYPLMFHCHPVSPVYDQAVAGSHPDFVVTGGEAATAWSWPLNLYLVQRLRMRAAVPPLTSTRTWSCIIALLRLPQPLLSHSANKLPHLPPICLLPECFAPDTVERRLSETSNIRTHIFFVKIFSALL